MKRAASNPPKPNARAARMPPAEWQIFRQQVMGAMVRRGFGFGELATATGYTPSTLETCLKQRAPATAAITAKLRVFVDGGCSGPADKPAGKAAEACAPREAPVQVPPEPAPAAGEATPAAPGSNSAVTLAARLKAKRRLVPMTTATLAGQLGVEVAELDAALAGQAVQAPAVERLAAWAGAG